MSMSATGAALAAVVAAAAAEQAAEAAAERADQAERAGAPLWIIKAGNFSRGIGIVVTRNWRQVLRLSESIPMVVQEYVQRPLLWHGRKFDLRFMALLRADGTAYCFRRYWPRVCPSPFTLADSSLDRFDVHFTVSGLEQYNASASPLACQEIPCEQFERGMDAGASGAAGPFGVATPTTEAPPAEGTCTDSASASASRASASGEPSPAAGSWSQVVLPLAHAAMRAVLTAARSEMQLGSGSGSGNGNGNGSASASGSGNGAMYGIDIMFTDGRGEGEGGVPQPRVLEVNFSPDCTRMSTHSFPHWPEADGELKELDGAVTPSPQESPPAPAAEQAAERAAGSSSAESPPPPPPPPPPPSLQLPYGTRFWQTALAGLFGPQPPPPEHAGRLVRLL
jgi:hypothetical protein